MGRVKLRSWCLFQRLTEELTTHVGYLARGVAAESVLDPRQVRVPQPSPRLADEARRGGRRARSDRADAGQRVRGRGGAAPIQPDRAGVPRGGGRSETARTRERGRRSPACGHSAATRTAPSRSSRARSATRPRIRTCSWMRVTSRSRRMTQERRRRASEVLSRSTKNPLRRGSGSAARSRARSRRIGRSRHSSARAASAGAPTSTWS